MCGKMTSMVLFCMALPAVAHRTAYVHSETRKAVTLMGEEAAAGSSELKNCFELPTYLYTDTPSGNKAGQCKPSQHAGAFYTEASDERPWQCWPIAEASHLSDQEAKTNSYAGACKFPVSGMTKDPSTVPACTEIPTDCSPGAAVYWGACTTKFGVWKCVTKHTDAGAQTAEQFIKEVANGDCASIHVPDTPDKLYTGVCRFTESESEPYKCDTVTNFDSAASSTCGGGGDWAGACFSLERGVNWQCFDQEQLNEKTPGMCETTPTGPDGANYDGLCKFRGADGYEDAVNANALEPKTPPTTTPAPAPPPTLPPAPAPTPAPPSPSPQPEPKPEPSPTADPITSTSAGPGDNSGALRTQILSSAVLSVVLSMLARTVG